MSCKHIEERKKRNGNNNFYSTENKASSKRRETEKEKILGFEYCFEAEKSMMGHLRSLSLTLKTSKQHKRKLLVNALIPVLKMFNASIELDRSKRN